MNKPLNTSAQANTFTGKIYNQNPHLKNTTLRLTPSQTQNPESVLDNFFQSYHLPDIRAILWQWLTVVLSSPRDSANNPHERNNHIFFYEKIEALIEAAWVLRHGNVQQTGTLSEKPVKPISTPAAVKALKTVPPACFAKPARLIEKTTSQPIEVIIAVFDQMPLADLTDDLLPNWLRVAVISTQSPYSYGNGREILYEFYEQLTQFVTQLYIASENQQLMKPSTLYSDFFQQCPIDYIRRELADFLEAGIGYDGAYPNGFSPWQAWMAYNHVLCLTEAAYQLYINQQRAPVSNILSQQPAELTKLN